MFLLTKTRVWKQMVWMFKCWISQSARDTPVLIRGCDKSVNTSKAKIDTQQEQDFVNSCLPEFTRTGFAFEEKSSHVKGTWTKKKSKSHSFSVFLVQSDRYLCSDLIRKRHKRVYIVSERKNCILTTVYCKLIALVEVNVPHRLTAFKICKRGVRDFFSAELNCYCLLVIR